MTRSVRFLPAVFLTGASLLLAALLTAAPPVTADAGSPPADDLPAKDEETAERIRELTRNAEYEEAERVAREALAAAEQQHGPDSLPAAYALDGLLNVLRRTTPGAEPAIGLALRAVRIKERYAEELPLELARSLNTLGVLYHDSPEPERAVPFYERSLALREAHGGAEEASFAFVLNNLGLLEYDRGNYRRALEAHQGVTEHLSRTLGPEDNLVGVSLMNQAMAYQDLLDFPAAEAAYDRALAILEGALGPDHPEVALALVNRAEMLGSIGRVAEALADLRRALEIDEAALGPDHDDTAFIRIHLGAELGGVGDYAAAEEMLERGRASLTAAHGPHHRHLNQALYELSELQIAQGNYARAAEFSLQAIECAEAVYSPDHDRALQSRLRRAYALGELGDRETAVRETGDLLTRLRNDATQEIWRASAHEHLGRLLAEPDPESARRHLELAIGLAEPRLGEGHPNVARMRAELAEACLAAGDLVTAAKEAVAAEAVSRRHLRLTAPALSERQALEYAASRASGLDVLVAVARRKSDAASARAAWTEVLRSRALVFDEMARRVRSEDPLSEELDGRLLTARTRLANRVVRGPDPRRPDAFRTDVDALRSEVESAERALGAATGRRPAREPALRDILGSLPPDAALVAYVRSSDPSTDVAIYSAFVGAANGEGPAVVPLGSARDIRQEVRRWRASIEAGANDPRGTERENRDAGVALRHRIWDPIVPHIAGASTVFLVADGILHRISWPALPATGNRYLVETGPLFHHLSAERDLLPDPYAAPVESGMLAVGGPDFDHREVLIASADGATRFRGPDGLCGDLESLRFGGLPAAAVEAAERASGWQSVDSDVVLLTGRQATETAIKSRAPGRRVLHLATHAYFLASCDDPPAHLAANPLLRSGLACAGANYRRSAADVADDGLLTAEEISALDLRGTQWAVLSGCATGTGVPRPGEGLFGLRRAFEAAGARTVVASLWRVEDDWARRWIDVLYREHWQNGHTVAEAVRQAGRDALEEQRRRGLGGHPFFWGGFVAVGDWR